MPSGVNLRPLGSHYVSAALNKDDPSQVYPGVPGHTKEITMRFKTVGLAMTFVLAILLAPFAAAAQQPGKVYRLGLLTGSSPASMASANEAFQQGLRELGYVEGKNVIMEYRYAAGNVDLLPA